MIILIDSSCWIEFFRPQGNPRVQTQICEWLNADQVATCGPVRAEILRGASKTDVSRIAKTFSALHYFEALDEDWATVAEKAQVLSGKGFHVPLIDLLIAVIAARNAATVAHHHDAHFEAMRTMVPNARFLSV